VPFPSEHAARVKSPDGFIEGSFRRKPITEGIDLIVGRLKDGDGSAVAQSYRFDKEKFTAQEARDWLKEHDVTVQLFEEATGEEKQVEIEQDDNAADDMQEKSTLEGEVSQEQQEMAVRRAFSAVLQPMQQPAVAAAYPSSPYIVDTYSNSVICEWAGKFYEVPFMRIGDEIAFAAQEDWVEVEKREEWLRKVKEMRAEAKAGRRVRSDKVGILRELKTKLDDLFKGLGEILGWAEYDDRKLSKGFKVIRTKDGEDWLLTWTTNAFEDRDGEIFQTKAIEEYVGRHEDQKDKGAFEFWHIPGSKFGTIRWQGVSGRFLAEAGPFDDTVVGQAFKAFLMEFPDGHPVIAPEGWGTSHGFRYRADDRKGGVYRWFEKEETSVLPGSVAANPYNPELEVIQMLSKKQIEALREIGGDKIVDLVTETGEKRTEELERAGVAYKAKKAGDLSSQLEAIAGEMEDEDMAKELRKLAGKIAKAVSKGKKEEPAEETEPTAADTLSGLNEFVAPLQAIASKAEGEVKTGLEGILAAMQPPAEPAAIKAADEPITRAEMEGVVQVLGAAVATLTAEVKALSQGMGKEVRREVKETLEETPRISLIELAAKSVIGKEETVVDGRKTIAKDGPKETDPTQLPEGRVFGIPLLDALKAAGQRQPQ